jgi:spore coat protein U-like protein
MIARRAFVACLIAAIMLLLPSRSDAACTISTSSVAFGSYNVFSASPVSSTGSITYRCGLLEALFGNITVTLSTGQSGTYSTRTMKKGTESLAYNLYFDAAQTSVWGNGTGGTQVYARTRPPYNSDVDLTVYGSLPAGQDVSSGNYSDTISATINF